jgi:hypothetical protein
VKWHERNTSPPLPLAAGKTAAITLSVALPACCPVSGNPRPGSTLTITYAPTGEVIDVLDLTRWVRSFRGGSPTGTRTMEAMIIDLAQMCADRVRVDVAAVADCLIEAGLPEHQRMRIECRAVPR